MPFTQISLSKGKSPDYRRELMEEVYLAMRESINIPENDRASRQSLSLRAATLITVETTWASVVRTILCSYKLL